MYIDNNRYIVLSSARVLHIKSYTTPMIRREFGSLDDLDGASLNITIPIILLFVIFFFRRI